MKRVGSNVSNLQYVITIEKNAKNNLCIINTASAASFLLHISQPRVQVQHRLTDSIFITLFIVISKILANTVRNLPGMFQC